MSFKILWTRKVTSETQAYNLLYSEGLTIKSTQDLAIQQICDEEASNDAYYPIVEYGITDYALTIHRADGSAENYSKENLKQYLISVRALPLRLFSVRKMKRKLLSNNIKALSVLIQMQAIL